MPGATTNFAWPFPLPGDLADVASDMQTLASAIDSTVGNAWTVFNSPSLIWSSSGTQPVLNDGSLIGAYKNLGKTIIFTGRLQLGAASTPGTGTYGMNLPVAALGGTSLAYNIGTGLVIDAGTGTNNQPMVVRLNGANAIRFYGTGGQVSNTVPFTWTTSDQLIWTIVYEAA